MLYLFYYVLQLKKKYYITKHLLYKEKEETNLKETGNHGKQFNLRGANILIAEQYIFYCSF